MRSICYALLEKHKGKGLSGHSMFLYELYRSGVEIDRLKNKQGKVYGLKFTYDGQSFKASEIGREFGYHTLPKQFESGNVQKPIIPSSHSSMRSTNDSTPIAQVAVSTVDTALDTAGSLLSEVGEVTTLQTHGVDYAEIAWQRRLRNQAGKKKKRRRWI